MTRMHLQILEATCAGRHVDFCNLTDYVIKLGRRTLREGGRHASLKGHSLSLDKVRSPETLDSLLSNQMEMS